MTKNTEQKQFAATAEGQAIAYPDFDMTPPEDLKGGILSLIREARGLIEDSPEFQSWKGKYYSTDYKANFEERLKLLVKNNKTYCPLAFQYFELAVYEDEIDDIQDRAYYYTLRKLAADLKKKTPLRTRDFISPLSYKTSKEIAERGQISVSLARNLSLQREPTLFDELNEKGRLSLMESDKENYIDRKGRSIVLTKNQNKIILALSHYLSQFQNDEDMQKYITALDNNPKKLPTEKIERSINLKDFDKTYTSPDGKTRPRQITALRKELRKTAQIAQVLYFGDTEKKARLIAPLISIEEELEDLTPDKSLNLDYVNIRFSPVFLYKMTREFSPISAGFIRLLGKKGSGTDTELFRVLLSDLLSKYPYCRQTALTKTHNVRKADFHTNEEYLAEYDKVQRESLTYLQNIDTLLEKITTDYSSCKQYRANFRKDLDGALAVLKDTLRLITYGGIVKNSKKGEALKVVFDPDYKGGGEKW